MSRRSTCAACPVRGSALCGALAADEIGRLSRFAHHRHYRPGAVIMSEDQPQDWFATVLSGVVKLTRTLADGRRQIVGLLFAADFLGRPFEGRVPCDAEAATDLELCCVNRAAFESLLGAAPAMTQLFLERTLAEVDAARDWMVLLGRKTAAEKVATLLLMLARRLAGPVPGRGSAIGFDLPLSRTEMADYLGLRIETVSRNIWELEAAGVVEIPNGRGIRVPDLEALERVAERVG